MRGKLPPARPGKEWGWKIFPGGRIEAQEYSPDMIMTNEEGLYALKSGSVARIKFGTLPREIADYLFEENNK